MIELGQSTRVCASGAANTHGRVLSGMILAQVDDEMVGLPRHRRPERGHLRVLRQWEQSITAHTGWFIFIWCFLLAYLVLFVVAFFVAVRRSTGIGGWRAAGIGLAAFGVFQVFEYVFLR